VIKIEPTADIPVPFDVSEESPRTQKDSIAVAANTINLIEQLGGGVDFNEKDGKQVVDLITKSAKVTPKHIKTSGQASAAAAILRKYDFQAVADAQQARNLITNKLIELADCGDLKIEIKALELLGKHSDIGIFTERSEITVHHTTSQSLENSIKERIKRLLHSDVTDITPLDDLDAQLGTPTTATHHTGHQTNLDTEEPVEDKTREDVPEEPEDE
jgi:transcriptional regulator